MHSGNDAAGDWRGLESSTQVPRYAAIAEMLYSFRANGNVLDVGCGAAVLRAWLPKDANYTGIEPSVAAVRIALERDTSAKIIHASAESFDACSERFDCIVFNEMLYYAADPVGLLRKYASLVRPGGMILCSIYQKPGGIPLKSRLWHWIDGQRPLSNVHCEKMIRAFMARHAWSILDDRIVPIPESSSQWHIWLATPHQCQRKSQANQPLPSRQSGFG